MKLNRNGLELNFDFRWKNHRVRGAIPIETIVKMIEGESTLGDSNLGPLKKEITFKEFAENMYLPRCSKPRKKESTYLVEMYSVRILNRFLGNLPIHKITPETREEFKEGRLTGKLCRNGKPCGHNRINNDLTCLNLVLQYSQEMGYIKKNPLQGLSRLPSGNRLDKWLRKQQIEELLNVCEGSFRNFVEFLIMTGGRLSEALFFNVNNFNNQKTDFRLLTLKGRKSKGEQYRWFNVNSLGERFTHLLEKMEPHPKTGYYFFNREGLPLKKTSVEHLFAKARAKVGLTDRHLHDLRHTFAMHRAMAGVSFWQLRVEMGHASAASIQRYLDDVKIYDKTESIFYQKFPQLSILENGQQRTKISDRELPIINKGKILNCVSRV